MIQQKISKTVRVPLHLYDLIDQIAKGANISISETVNSLIYSTLGLWWEKANEDPKKFIALAANLALDSEMLRKNIERFNQAFRAGLVLGRFCGTYASAQHFLSVLPEGAKEMVKLYPDLFPK